MKIPIKWINELIESKKIGMNNLVEKLTFGGFEVEEILEIEIENRKEVILDISATANRSDSLSIQGISVEMGALLNGSFKILNYSVKAINWKILIQNLAFTFSTDEKCFMFLTIKVENLKNLEIPRWVSKKLLSSSIVPLNNLLDFQNYILLETGYPFTFYDIEKIYKQLNDSKFNLSISNSKIKRKFLATNNKTYTLDDSIFTINANKCPISIAGLIENKNTMYVNTTSMLLIEGSIFSSKLIRQHSRKLGLRTDRSARYEKSLQKTYLIEAFYRLICLFRISNPTLVCKLHTFKNGIEQMSNSIQLRYKTINEILGPIDNSKNLVITYLTTKTIHNYLNQLNFKFTYNHIIKIWRVQVPDIRMNDLKREIDLIEEIGRLHGFNNFSTTLPKLRTVGIEDNTYKIYKKITKYMLNLGLNELVTYSLVSPKTFLQNNVNLFNPLLLDYSNLRISLLPNLVTVMHENLKQTNIYLNGFEYGHIFQKNFKDNFEEKEYIGGIFGGNEIKLSWSQSFNKMTWFEAKGKIQQLLTQLNLITYWKPSNSEKTKTILHPYRSADIYLLDHTLKIGHFGQIHPFLAYKLNLSNNIYLFEFNIEMIKNNIEIKKLPLYSYYSIYPKITKDLSFVIKKNVSFHRIKKTIYANGTNFLSKISLLNEYTNHTIPKDSISLCLQLVFQSSTTTLENKKIDSIFKNIEKVLTDKFNVFIRK